MGIPDRPSRTLPDRPDLRFLKDEAKRRVKKREFATLAKAQLTIAREHGFESWPRLKEHIESIQKPESQAADAKPLTKPVECETTEAGSSFWSHRDVETVFEGDGFFILRRGQRTQLYQFSGRWTSEHTKLALKHDVSSVSISEASFGEQATAGFLLDMPLLRELHIGLGKPKDLSAITKLDRLESLTLAGDIVSPRHGSSLAVDLTTLKHLKYANIQLCPPIQSVLGCETLQHLEVWNKFDPPLDLIMKRNGVARFREWTKQQKVDLNLVRLTRLTSLHLKVCPELRDLDLTRQPALSELQIEAAPKLRSIRLHPEARVRKLKFNRWGACRIDWQRMGPDLKELELVGPLKFAFEDVLNAPNLEVISTNGIQKFPPLRFLLKLPCLHTFDFFSTPPGPKFSEEDWAVIREIGARKHE